MRLFLGKKCLGISKRERADKEHKADFIAHSNQALALIAIAFYLLLPVRSRAESCGTSSSKKLAVEEGQIHGLIAFEGVPEKNVTRRLKSHSEPPDEDPAVLIKKAGTDGYHLIPDLAHPSKTYVMKDGRIYEFEIVTHADGKRIVTLRSVTTEMPPGFDPEVFELATGAPFDKFARSRQLDETTSKVQAARLPAPMRNQSPTLAQNLGHQRKFYYFSPKIKKGEGLPISKKTGTPGFVDHWGNVWVKGPSRTTGQAFEWDVQLSSNAPEWMRKPPFSRNGKYINVALDGTISH